MIGPSVPAGTFDGIRRSSSPRARPPRPRARRRIRPRAPRAPRVHLARAKRTASDPPTRLRRSNSAKRVRPSFPPGIRRDPHPPFVLPRSRSLSIRRDRAIRRRLPIRRGKDHRARTYELCGSSCGTDRSRIVPSTGKGKGSRIEDACAKRETRGPRKAFRIDAGEGRVRTGNHVPNQGRNGPSSFRARGPKTRRNRLRTVSLPFLRSRNPTSSGFVRLEVESDACCSRSSPTNVGTLCLRDRFYVVLVPMDPSSTSNGRSNGVHRSHRSGIDSPRRAPSLPSRRKRDRWDRSLEGIGSSRGLLPRTSKRKSSPLPFAMPFPSNEAREKRSASGIVRS